MSQRRPPRVGVRERGYSVVPRRSEPVVETQVVRVGTRLDDASLRQKRLRIARRWLGRRFVRGDRRLLVEGGEHPLGEVAFRQRRRAGDEILTEPDGGERREQERAGRDRPPGSDEATPRHRDAGGESDRDSDVRDRTRDTPILARLRRLSETTDGHTRSAGGREPKLHASASEI